MPKKEWIDKLSPAAKAEILASVLHELECGMAKKFAKLPRKFQKLVNRAMRDCGIWHDDLTKKDYRQIQEWFAQDK